jgi:hypothetical protein
MIKMSEMTKYAAPMAIATAPARAPDRIARCRSAVLIAVHAPGCRIPVDTIYPTPTSCTRTARRADVAAPPLARPVALSRPGRCPCIFVS